jgi:hypothetical protein
MLGWFPEGNRILFLSDRGGTWGIWALSVADGQAKGDPMLIKADTGRIWPMGFSRKGEFFYTDGEMSITFISPCWMQSPADRPRHLSGWIVATSCESKGRMVARR